MPEAEFDTWQHRGFTHIWLMGVWTTGPQSRAVALAVQDLQQEYRRALPDYEDTAVSGSPYSIADYRVPKALGGESGLKKFRKRLNERGMKLILDFVPNHVGLDHLWLKERPQLFVRGDANTPGVFEQQTRAAVRWIAHGKDPYFPPWSDTAQLDYRNPETCAAMQETLLGIAERCDGVRCDMAMLILNDIFNRTWSHLPCSAKETSPEFWATAISETKHAHSGFLFLAEAYWDLEARLQSLGFDYTYDKKLYDAIIHRNAAAVQQHLPNTSADYIRASAHFLENHDEPRIATLLSTPEHRAAALLVLALPGMRFLHEGEIVGARVKSPVQLSRRCAENPNPEIAQIYDTILNALKKSSIGHGTSTILAPQPAWPENSTFGSFVIGAGGN